MYVPISTFPQTLLVFAAGVRGHMSDRLLKQVRPLLFDRLPLGVLHDVVVILAAVRQRHPLEVATAVVLREEEDVCHVERIDNLAQVLLTVQLQPRQLKYNQFTNQGG